MATAAVVAAAAVATEGATATTTGQSTKKKRSAAAPLQTPLQASTTPRFTVNWYDATELACAQRTCVRRGFVLDAVRIAIERDRSGDGMGVFASLATSCLEDVGLALPMALTAVLVSMNMWEADAASGRRAESRAHLIAAVASVASWPKSRLLADASVKSIHVDLAPIVASMTTEAAFGEMGGHALLTKSVEWANAIAEPAPSMRKSAAAAAIEAHGRIDFQRVVATFAGLARVANEVWSDGVTAADTQQELNGDDVDDSPRDNGDGVPDGDPDKMEVVAGGAAASGCPGEASNGAHDQAALAEGTRLMVEEGVLALAHIMIATETIEGRRIDWPTKGNAITPPFVTDAERLINSGADRNANSAAFWPTLAGETMRDFFTRPVAWAFGPLLAVARGANCERAVMALLSLVEALARGIVHPRLALVSGVLIAARLAVLSWEERKIDFEQIAAQPDIARAIEAYGLASVSDLVANGIPDAAAISAARTIVVDPERHLDGTTPRHSGLSTLAALEAHISNADRTDGAATACWTPAETAKSHGPALGVVPSDACLAAGVSLAFDPDNDFDSTHQVDNSYAPTSEVEAADRVRAWKDHGDAIARSRHPVWARSLPDAGYVVPTPSKRSSSSSSGTKRQPSTAQPDQEISLSSSSPTVPSTLSPASKKASTKRRREPAPSRRAKADARATHAQSVPPLEDALASTMPSLSATSLSPPARKRHKITACSSVSKDNNCAMVTLVRSSGTSEMVRASEALDVLCPGRLLRIVEVIYEEVDPLARGVEACDAVVRLSPSVCAVPGVAVHALNDKQPATMSTTSTSAPTPLVLPLTKATPSGMPPPGHSPNEETAVVDAPEAIAAATAQSVPSLAPGRTLPSRSGGASTRATATGRSRSRAAEALAPCPDLVARLAPKVLDDAAIVRIQTAPLAQKPTLTTKKCVYMLADGAYKGPYAVDQRADVVRVVRTLYRERVMRDLWGDTIVARHEPVFDPHARVIYLRMDLVGDRGPDGDEPWSTVPCTVKRGGAEHDVEVVNRDSHGLVIINSMLWLGSENFVGAFAKVVVHMAARYLIDGGDANLNNIIGCPRRGAASVCAVDIEDNRNCSKKKKKKTKKSAAASSPATCVESDDPMDVVPGSEEPKMPPAPTLMRCLFAPGRGPKADEQPTFDALLREHMGIVRDFTDRVRESLASAEPTEIIPGAADYAREIGYVEATMGAEVPTCGQVAARLHILEACLDEFEGIVDEASADA
jgi:hypothetical protein